MQHINRGASYDQIWRATRVDIMTNAPAAAVACCVSRGASRLAPSVALCVAWGVTSIYAQIFPCETIHPDWNYRSGANSKVTCCSARRPGVGEGTVCRVKRAITKKSGLPRVVGRRSRLTKPDILSGGATTDDGATDLGQHVTQQRRRHNGLRATMITTGRCDCTSFSLRPRALFN